MFSAAAKAMYNGHFTVILSILNKIEKLKLSTDDY